MLSREAIECNELVSQAPGATFQTEGSGQARSDRTHTDALFRQRLSFYVGEIDPTSCIYDERNRGRPTNL